LRRVNRFVFIHNANRKTHIDLTTSGSTATIRTWIFHWIILMTILRPASSEDDIATFYRNIHFAYTYLGGNVRVQCNDPSSSLIEKSFPVENTCIMCAETWTFTRRPVYVYHTARDRNISFRLCTRAWKIYAFITLGQRTTDTAAVYAYVRVCNVQSAHAYIRNRSPYAVQVRVRNCALLPRPREESVFIPGPFSYKRKITGSDTYVYTARQRKYRLVLFGCWRHFIMNDDAAERMKCRNTCGCLPTPPYSPWQHDGSRRTSVPNGGRAYSFSARPQLPRALAGNSLCQSVSKTTSHDEILERNPGNRTWPITRSSLSFRRGVKRAVDRRVRSKTYNGKSAAGPPDGRLTYGGMDMTRTRRTTDLPGQTSGPGGGVMAGIHDVGGIVRYGETKRVRFGRAQSSSPAACAGLPGAVGRRARVDDSGHVCRELYRRRRAGL